MLLSNFGPRDPQSMHCKVVPLNPSAEYHSRADPITVEMRRVLADLVKLLPSGRS